ncbi:MAG: NUDIX domain-containing protein [Caldisericales bacterium]|nr:NUDIX domain-containing protein [Caldisericales bacterium]
MSNHNKVIAYITKGTKILIFDHVGFPEAGTQVPAGTIKDGETPTFAAMREAFEETGLHELYLKEFLGMQTITLERLEGRVIISRHYYHFEAPDDTPDAWLHYEMDPSEGPPDPILFSFKWVDFSKNSVVLAGKQDFFMYVLGKKCIKKNR